MILLILHILVSLCLLTAVASVYIPYSALPIPVWFGLAFEWLVIAEIVTAVLLLFTKRRRWVWLGLAVLLLSAAPISYTVSHQSLFFPKRELPHSFTLMQYNVFYLDNARKAKQNRVIQYILRTKPDIVCMQEVRLYKSKYRLSLPELREAMKIYPYTYFDFKSYDSHHQSGNAVFSMYPLVGKHTLRYESRGNITSVCDIILPTDTIRLYNIHLESNKLMPKDLTIGSTTTQTKSAVNSTTAKLTKASERRIQQARIVHDDAERSPHPVLLVGDMNTTPVSHTYRVLQSGLRDAFLESSNWELGHTYEMHHIGVRIDYILHSKQLSASDFEVPHVDYSDHYPVITTIHY